jgi:hypothetical protein
VHLKFSDGRSDVTELEKVNDVLRTIGVRVSTVSIPDEAKPIIKAFQIRATTPEEQKKLISNQPLDRFLFRDAETAGDGQPDEMTVAELLRIEDVLVSDLPMQRVRVVHDVHVLNQGVAQAEAEDVEAVEAD